MTDHASAPPSGSQAAAFFDVDGTLTDTTIAHCFRYFMLRRLSPLRAWVWEAGFLARCGYYLVVDKIDRGRFNEIFYRNYAGIPATEIKALAAECHRDLLVPRQFDQAADCIAEHRRAGDEIVLVTGSLDFIVAPLAREFGARSILAASLVEEGGRFTGRLSGPPIGAGEKARRIREYAATERIDLTRSHAYGDSISDLAMLETVGFAHAVNPDRSLASTARARGWPIHKWKGCGGASRDGR